ncbi:hypothetical protein ABEV34_11945 [Methylorubrum rhodesianum]|uniref:hypothetical protein n=1 Tax=Methylorubrum rhodesianum TaxID=29427 RepID=UPI003D2B6B20
MPTDQEIGATVYAALTTVERASLREALRATQVDEYDDFHCALGNLGYGWPVGQGRGRRVTQKDARKMCGWLAELRTRPDTDDTDWGRLLCGAFGEADDRVAGLYVEAGLPETKPALD